MLELYINTIILGLVEGITEFLPVSSTGHLLLMDAFLKFQGPPGHVFEIVVQLGAIMSVMVIYFSRLWNVFISLPSDGASRRFVYAVLLAFLPAALIGAMAHDFIKSVLFNPLIVSISLIIGGFIIILIEKKAPKPEISSVEEMPLKTAIYIGICQCIAMIPGVSRSGATIMGALMLKVDRKTAAEFSFFLAIPTMFGAAALDIYKNAGELVSGDAAVIAIGFIVAFISALIVVRGFVDFVGRHGFIPFAWYRIIVGGLALIFLCAI